MRKKPNLRGLKAKAWKVFSEYIRRRYADAGGTAECFTCGALAYWKDLQCGHAIGGRHNAVLLDEEICRPQCCRCNIFMRGNYPVFTTKLIRRHGVAWFEGKLQQARQIVKWARSDLEGLIEQYKAKLAALPDHRVR